tara:strand:+ start:1152 stop:1628 length:477 start_codon:yes stop_codon:yes gene_type:complete
MVKTDTALLIGGGLLALSLLSKNGIARDIGKATGEAFGGLFTETIKTGVEFVQEVPVETFTFGVEAGKGFAKSLGFKTVDDIIKEHDFGAEVRVSDYVSRFGKQIPVGSLVRLSDTDRVFIRGFQNGNILVENIDERLSEIRSVSEIMNIIDIPGGLR